MKRRLRLLLPIAVAAFASLGWHVGWLQAPGDWREATGWQALAAGPKPTSRFEIGKESVTISWLGHAGFVLEWAGARILLDPNTSSHCTLATRVLEPTLPPEELGAIDLALISHAHFDHLDLPTLRGLRELDRIAVPVGAGRYVEEVAATGTRVRELRVGDRLVAGEIEVIATPAEHNGNRLHPLQSHEGALGYVIRHHGEAIYFAGDTGYGSHFAAIGARYHPWLALLPIGAYAPRFPMHYYHLSPEEAVQAAEDLGVARVIPMHFGTFALALDRPSSALPRFARAAAAASLPWSMPALLTPSSAEDSPLGT